MPNFKLHSTYKPTSDQPEAIFKLVNGINKGHGHQTLLGVTGSGKTFTMANVIAQTQKPTLIISHNKTLAAQLYQEFKEFFPENAVCYFVSYYDYYQPEAYIPQTDTYIEKETEINEEIDKLRLAATTNLMTRRDVIVVASVSCIYNIGSPVEYGKFTISLNVGQEWKRYDLLREFAKLQYVRNETDFKRGVFRVRSENIEIHPSYSDNALRLQFLGYRLEKIEVINPLTGNRIDEFQKTVIYPAKHYVTSQDILNSTIDQIKIDLETQEKVLKKQGKALFAHRLHQRTMYDIEMMQSVGYCNGIENYSRYSDGRKPGDPPYALLNYFPKDFLLFIDESHMTVPQIRGMYHGDRSRKETLVDFGFRLPSALDNRPLRYGEFSKLLKQVVYVSATPDEYELSISDQVVEQLIRPTGLLDPKIIIKPTKGQIDDLIEEIKKRTKEKERVLVTTLTKRMAEELAYYLQGLEIKVHYLHSEIKTLERVDILDDLRLGKYDVVVGINLLREGLDLPEVSLVAILDADKEGFLRSETALIQTMGRAARHVNGMVIMYADTTTGSMKKAIDEVKRRLQVQVEYNKKHKIKPKGIEKPLREKIAQREERDWRAKSGLDEFIEHSIKRAQEGSLLADDREKLIKFLQNQMRQAAKELEFERAAVLRDQILSLKSSFGLR
ncbi:excinuclease ABC subunit B [Candidatus Curtissbacteria bacterium RBG_16_39_7]|uniref:UvrABC system protein B n=1 Tax=Candidatus Curtissbacteria bacterium RBG_16_39_7 TaxID=1797707 RepID=A0A1F5G4P0_9BACT|nr:MAG: excinuclease ABC subunit B [Candidatus Curtissbacteria bacterium RBG_16_39_7]